MTTITERLEQKRAEYEQAESEHQRLWVAMQEAKAQFEQKFNDPWYNAHLNKERVKQELAIVEAVAKEMQ